MIIREGSPSQGEESKQFSEQVTEQSKVPENIDGNFTNALSLFQRLCPNSRPNSMEELKAEKIGHFIGIYRLGNESCEVLMYPPRMSESRRQDLDLFGEAASLPQVVTKYGTREVFDDLIAHFRYEGIKIEPNYRGTQ